VAERLEARLSQPYRLEFFNDVLIPRPMAWAKGSQSYGLKQENLHLFGLVSSPCRRYTARHSAVLNQYESSKPPRVARRPTFLVSSTLIESAWAAHGSVEQGENMGNGLLGSSQIARKAGTRRIRKVLFSRIAAFLGGVLSLLVVLGCMNFGSLQPAEVKVGAAADEPGVLKQDGKTVTRPGKDQVIYYPMPYTSPPNLQVTDGANACEIVEQTERYFRVRFPANAPAQQDVTWTARGPRVAQSVTIEQNSPTPASSVVMPAVAPVGNR
jgi:hypothetical protein